MSMPPPTRDAGVLRAGTLLRPPW